MYLYRCFLGRRYLLYIILLVVMGVTTSILALGFMVFNREFVQRLTIAEIGAIPEVQVEFKENIDLVRLNLLADRLRKEIDLDYLYCGNKFSTRMRFGWSKFQETGSGSSGFDELTHHDFDVP